MPDSFGRTSDNLVYVYEALPYRCRNTETPKVFWVSYTNGCSQMMSALPENTIFGKKIVSDLPVQGKA